MVLDVLFLTAAAFFLLGGLAPATDQNLLSTLWRPAVLLEQRFAHSLFMFFQIWAISVLVATTLLFSVIGGFQASVMGRLFVLLGFPILSLFMIFFSERKRESAIGLAVNALFMLLVIHPSFLNQLFKEMVILITITLTATTVVVFGLTKNTEGLQEKVKDRIDKWAPTLTPTMKHKTCRTVFLCRHLHGDISSLRVEPVWLEDLRRISGGRNGHLFRYRIFLWPRKPALRAWKIAGTDG